MFIVQYAAVFITVASTLLSLAYAEREFPQPRTESRFAKNIAPRCYRLTATMTGGWSVHVPSIVRLTTESTADRSEAGFYEAQFQSADSLPSYRYDHLGPVRWRPIDPDSLDIVFLGWPTSMRLRIPSTGHGGEGRLRVSGDVGSVVPFNGVLHRIDWDPMFRISAANIACDSAARKG